MVKQVTFQTFPSNWRPEVMQAQGSRIPTTALKEDVATLLSLWIDKLVKLVT